MEALIFCVRIALFVMSCTFATFLGPPYPVGPHYHTMIHPPVLNHVWHKPMMIAPHMEPPFMKPFFHRPVYPPMMKPAFKPMFKPKPFFRPKPFFKKMMPLIMPKVIVKKIRFVKPPVVQIRQRVRKIPRPNNFRYVRPSPKPRATLPIPVFRRNVFTGYRQPPRTQRIDIPQIRPLRPPQTSPSQKRASRPLSAPVSIPIREESGVLPLRRETVPTPIREESGVLQLRQQAVPAQRIRQWIQAAHGAADDDDDNYEDIYDDDEDDDFEDYWEDKFEDFDDKIVNRFQQFGKHYYENDDDDDSSSVNNVGAQQQTTQYQQYDAFVPQSNSLIGNGIGRHAVTQQHFNSQGNF